MSIGKSLRSVGVSFFYTCITVVTLLLMPGGPANANEEFQITPALNDAWYDPETSGQGFFITVLPDAGIVFLSWFTYDTQEANKLGEAHLGEPNHRWLTAQGPIIGNHAEMTVYISSGGVFDTTTTVANLPDGTLSLSFQSCSKGQVEYDIPSIGRKGTIPIQRVVEDNVAECESRSSATSSGSQIQSVGLPAKIQTSGGLVSTGMNDAWYNPATSGQGFFITVLPKASIVFLAWFTYDTDEAGNTGLSHFGEPNHRWLTAQGPIDGDMSEMTVYITSGGLFDTGTPVENRVDGTLKLHFDGCNSGSVDYAILSINRQGTVPIQRVVPDNANSCESQLAVEPWERWIHEDVKVLDDWGEQADEHSDLVALYEKEESSRIALRVDFMDLNSISLAPTYLGLDIVAGGISNVIQGNSSLNLDIDWDVLIVAQGENISAFDSAFNKLDGVLTNPVIDHRLDFFSVDIDKSVVPGWDGGEFSLQALTASSDKAVQIDETSIASSNSQPGRAKFVLPHMNAFANTSPADIGAYDGYWLSSFLQENKRGGLRYLLDAAEKYGLPVVISDLRLDRLSGNEFLGLMDRFRAMDGAGTLSMLSNMNYGHFMAWWPDVVDRNAIDLALKLKTSMNAPISEVFYPYEAILTTSDIDVIKNAGFKAIWGLDQYRYWFGPIPDNATPDEWAANLKSLRKIHRINDMDFFFDTRIGNYGGLNTDSRWGNTDWSAYSEAWLSEGSDGGLHSWLRRTLLDMAREADQEQFYTFGTDLGYSRWQYGDVADTNFRWLASHPWIEVTTFDDIASRNWGVIDHGTLDLAADELLIQFEREGDQHYNAYLPYFYYGGVSNGHSPIVPQGVRIESLYDYVPILRDGLPISSGRIMGDHKTPGSIIYETIKNLETAPDNSIAELAWLAFHHAVGEITYHEGEKLSNSSKFQANYVGHVNKVVAAANWAEQAAAGLLSSTTVVTAEDLDLDAENEYTMHNDQVFAVFENDGGRLEYAFAFDPANGPVQLVAPFNQHNFYVGSVEQYELGETAISTLNWGRDSAFSENQSTNSEGFEYAVMTATMTSSALKFQSEDGRISKEFTLAGDSVTASYSLDSIESIAPIFAFVTNLRNTYGRDWDKALQPINVNDEEIGWQCSKGGYAAVITDDTWLMGSVSFIESPAPSEMRQRDDAGSYPVGHGIPYPYGLVRVSSENVGSDFKVSIVLSAKD